MTAFDLGEDILGLGLPDEGLGGMIPRRDEFLDGENQIGDAGEAAAAHSLAGQITEPALHQIEPTGAGRDEMHLEARVSGQPALADGVLGGVGLSSFFGRFSASPEVGDRGKKMIIRVALT